MFLLHFRWLRLIPDDFPEEFSKQLHGRLLLCQVFIIAYFINDWHGEVMGNINSSVFRYNNLVNAATSVKNFIL